MFLSNKKLRLIIITLLLLIFCFFIGIFKPKALEYYTAKPNNTVCSNAWQCWFQFNNILDNRGDMEMVGQLYYKSTGVDTSTYLPMEFKVITYDDTKYACDIGNTYAYEDSNVDTYVMSFKCRLKTTQGNGVKFIHFITQINSDYVFDIDYVTFIWGFDNNNNSSAINNIQNNTNNINNSINDSNVDSNNATSSASSWNSKNATNGTITQLLTLPITLLQAIVNGLQTSCSSFSLGSLFGTNITLPCIDIGSLIGSALFTTIDILFSGFMILSISKKLIKIFNDFTNLKSNQIDELYGGGSK